MMIRATRPLAIVTGASSGIGYHLALIAAKRGFDLVIAADELRIENAAADFRKQGVNVTPVIADLATLDGAEQLLASLDGQSVDILIANAGRGLGKGFLDQDFDEVRRVVDTNVTGTLYLIQQIGRQMRGRRKGRILITGSIAGFMPGTFHAVYNASKAFIDSFSYALREELEGTGVTVTCLMPGGTETDFFRRADLLDTKIGQSEKDDPAEVAEEGFDAMMSGDAEVVTGWKNKIQSMLANITPAERLAEKHRKLTEPGTGTDED
jgi:short-subunit dehydrogenase